MYRGWQAGHTRQGDVAVEKGDAVGEGGVGIS